MIKFSLEVNQPLGQLLQMMLFGILGPQLQTKNPSTTQPRMGMLLYQILLQMQYFKKLFKMKMQALVL